MDPVAVILTPDNVEGYEIEIKWTKSIQQYEDYRAATLGTVLFVDADGPRLLTLPAFFATGWRFKNNMHATMHMSPVYRTV